MAARKKSELMKESRERKRDKAESLGLVEFRGWITIEQRDRILSEKPRCPIGD